MKMQVIVIFVVIPCNGKMEVPRSSKIHITYTVPQPWRPWQRLQGPPKHWYPTTTEHYTASHPRRPWLESNV